MNTGTLYLIPTPISTQNPESTLPAGFLQVVNQLEVFITENIRTTRRFLRAVGYDKDFDKIPYHLLNKHTQDKDLHSFLDQATAGHPTGLFSEAGMPCIADPGAKVVRIAHEIGIRVVPVNGPSSIVMALAASGFNGQNFAFNGYLPVADNERAQRIKLLENRAAKEDQTQIFIEAPYRNNKMLQALIQNCKPDTRICIASDITGAQEFIKTLPAGSWKKQNLDLHKKNTVFLIYK